MNALNFVPLVIVLEAMPEPKTTLPEGLYEMARPIMEGNFSHVWEKKIVLPNKFRKSFPNSQEEEMGKADGNLDMFTMHTTESYYIFDTSTFPTFIVIREGYADLDQEPDALDRMAKQCERDLVDVQKKRFNLISQQVDAQKALDLLNACQVLPDTHKALLAELEGIGGPDWGVEKVSEIWKIIGLIPKENFPTLIQSIESGLNGAKSIYG